MTQTGNFYLLIVQKYGGNNYATIDLANSTMSFWHEIDGITKPSIYEQYLHQKHVSIESIKEHYTTSNCPCQILPINPNLPVLDQYPELLL